MHLLGPLYRLFRAYRSIPSPSRPTPQPREPEFHRPTQHELLEHKEMLERILIKNIIPFWYPGVIDLEEGGYKLNHDIDGMWKGRTSKYLVTQARTVWFFSRLYKSIYGKNEHLEAARHGFEFLRDKMWDREFGGFFWKVDSSGNLINKPIKQLYGQAFGLYALSEYATASGGASASIIAKELFSLLEHQAHDSRYGGYRECFRRDWNPAPADTIGYLSVFPNIKLMNTHLHLMEAFITYHILTRDPIARERLIELVLIQSNTVVRKRIAACTDKYKCDWMPLNESPHNRISYGHNLENITLLIEACDTLGIPNGPLNDLYRTLFNYSLRHGFDQKKGGFYHAGYYNKEADMCEKMWWVQAEGLLCSFRMYLLTEEKVFFNCFTETLDWIVKNQVDWEHGEWFASIGEDGSPSGNKAGEWKSPYHNGRAIIQSLELIESLSK